MASRFWSRSDSDSESDYGSDFEPWTMNGATTQIAQNRYLRETITDKYESDEQKRNNKGFEEVSAAIDYLKAMQISDREYLQDSLVKINKQLQKVMRVAIAQKVPTLFIKALIMLEHFVNYKERLSSKNAKALKSMKKTLKKNNKQFKDLINACKENLENDKEHEADTEKTEKTSDSGIGFPSDIAASIGQDEEPQDNLPKSNEPRKKRGNKRLALDALVKNLKDTTWETDDNQLKVQSRTEEENFEFFKPQALIWWHYKSKSRWEVV